ncbi:MAG: Stp1/IreP family PP2C-type Ser/Thr phosphatase [Elusimicrobiota bacterium]
MLKINYTSLTDTGKKRQLNEDSLGVYEKEKLFFVCDGMGGHAAGDVASRLAVETIIDYLKHSSQTEFSPLNIQNFPAAGEKAKHLVSAVKFANRRLFNLAVDHPPLRGMGTTVAGVIFNKNSLAVVHAGDSRVYLFRRGQLNYLTEDHSWLNELIQDKEISSEEAKNFKQKNVITRALGTNPVVKIDLRMEKPLEGDLLLICTDGLTAPLSDEAIRKILKSGKSDLKTAAEDLIKSANERGGPDNITVILLEVEKIEEEESEAENKEWGRVHTVCEEEPALTDEIDRKLKKLYSKEVLPFIIPETKSKIWQKPLFYFFVAGGLVVSSLFGYRLLTDKPPLPPAPVSSGAGIRIDTIPAAAAVYLDEETTPRGQTPLTLSLEIKDVKADNFHTLRLVRAGYLSKEINCEVLPNNEVTITEVLSPEAKLELVLDIEASFSEKTQIYLKKKGNEEVLLTAIAKLRNIAFVGDLSEGDFTILVKDENSKVEWLSRFSAKIGQKVKVYVGRKNKKTAVEYENM